MKELRIIALDANNIETFLQLLEERGFSNNQINKGIYNNFNQYGGFIAFDGLIAVGCIGYVKRLMQSIESKQNILWFNDWYVKPSMRGQNVGTKLISAVISLYGAACGIVTPLKSQKVAEKLFDSVFHFYELTLPISPLQYGYQRYLRNNKYNDTILKRILRSFSFYIKWAKASRVINKFKIKPIKLEYIDSENINIFNSYHNEGRSLLKYDNNILKAISIMSSNNKQIQFWKATWENRFAVGMNKVTPSSQIETVVLYFSLPELGKEIEFISNLYRYFNSINFCNQLSILMPEAIKIKLQINDVFCKHTPLFITSKYLSDDFLIYNMDKDSSWR